MKCVKMKNTSEITRVNEIEAARLVKSGTHTYVAKKEWKKGRKTSGSVKSGE
jgi:hypothetical protein